MIKAIIFDLWETLGTKNVAISRILGDHFGIERSHDYMLAYENAIQLEAWPTREDMARNFLNFFKIPLQEEHIRFIVDLIDEGIQKATLFEGMNELLEKLHQNYKLGLLSNTTVFEAQVPVQWQIDSLFTAQVYSWQLGSLKPARKNFEGVCQELQVELTDSLFIDDGEKNVQAASELGMQAVRFQNMSQLVKDLQTLGIQI